MSLLNISSDVWADVVCKWTEIADLCRFDSALCNHHHRPHLLSRDLHSPSSSVHGCVATGMTVECYAWMLQRNLSVRSLRLELQQPMKFLQFLSQREMRTLTSIHVTRMTTGTDLSHLKFLISQALKSNLTELHVTDNADFGWLSASPGSATRLQTINLSRSEQVSSKIIDTIARNCPDLTALDLSGCECLPCLESVFVRCTNLNSVDLTHCHHLSDDHLSGLCIGKPSLRRLSIVGCSEVTTPQVLNILVHCQELQWLDIRGCCLVDAAALRKAADKVPDRVAVIILHDSFVGGKLQKWVSTNVFKGVFLLSFFTFRHLVYEHQADETRLAEALCHVVHDVIETTPRTARLGIVVVVTGILVKKRAWCMAKARKWHREAMYFVKHKAVDALQFHTDFVNNTYSSAVFVFILLRFVAALICMCAVGHTKWEAVAWTLVGMLSTMWCVMVFFGRPYKHIA